jgi:hypothetical protein
MAGVPQLAAELAAAHKLAAMGHNQLYAPQQNTLTFALKSRLI